MHAILELAKKKTVIFDGGMGTMLMAAGLKAGESPELWNIEEPSHVTDIHRKYYEAGSDVVHTNTFGGNTIKLAERGLADKMETIKFWAPASAGATSFPNFYEIVRSAQINAEISFVLIIS